jgi:hypothetical protein
VWVKNQSQWERRLVPLRENVSATTHTGNLELIFYYKSDLIIINLRECALNDNAEKSDEKLQELNNENDWCILYVLAHKPGTINSGTLVCCIHTARCTELTTSL